MAAELVTRSVQWVQVAGRWTRMSIMGTGLPLEKLGMEPARLFDRDDSTLNTVILMIPGRFLNCALNGNNDDKFICPVPKFRVPSVVLPFSLSFSLKKAYHFFRQSGQSRFLREIRHESPGEAERKGGAE